MPNILKRYLGSHPHPWQLLLTDALAPAAVAVILFMLLGLLMGSKEVTPHLLVYGLLFAYVAVGIQSLLYALIMALTHALGLHSGRRLALSGLLGALTGVSLDPFSFMRWDPVLFLVGLVTGLLIEALTTYWFRLPDLGTSPTDYPTDGKG